MKFHRLELIDALRFLGALAVVAAHWGFAGISNGKVDSLSPMPDASNLVYSVQAVNLFFMVSGFVIVGFSQGRTAGQFFVSRGVRILPPFLAAMLLTTIVVTLWGREDFAVTPVQFVANLTMVPTIFGQPPVDGVYWTLLIELEFYALIFVALFCKLGRFLHVLFPLWAVLMLVIALAAPQLTQKPLMGDYFTFIVSGAIIATIRLRGPSPLLLIGLAAALVSTFAFVVRQVPDLNERYGSDISPLVSCLITGCIFLAFMSLWIPRVTRIRIPMSRVMSDLTYPVYLLHAHIGYTILNLFGTDANRWALYLIMFIALILVSWLLHWFVDVRLKNVSYRVFTLLRRPIDALQKLVIR
ncbi:acyltransferase family protein [Leucobacter musarum]|uniref:acyltransferase family protein n=1 Tax=Leucobacter musarum TaxID=1930747 RepID=UPI0006A79945|nr:acyltransferase [Leucobacter musarum]